MAEQNRRRFAAVFEQHYDSVLAYATRRSDPHTAQEVASETFLVAWRRIADVPPGDAARPWLFVVARNVMANQRRGEYRRANTEHAAGVFDSRTRHPRDIGDATVEQLVVRDALASLTPDDREVLMLVAWDGLTHREAAQVVGCSTATLGVRVHRARRRLAAALEPPAPLPSPSPATPLKELS